MDPIASGMHRQLVSYPYFGDVPCFIADLEPREKPAFAGAAVEAF